MSALYSNRLWDSEKEDVYNANKEYFNRNSLTKDDAAGYIAGNHYIWLESQYDAIVNGTCDY